MPQGGRKKPFSAKQKKEQLKQKRDQKRDEEKDEFGRPVHRHHKRSKAIPKVESEEEDSDYDNEDEMPSGGVKKINYQPVPHKRYDPNRYRLHFMEETREEIERRKHQAKQPFQMLPEEALEIDLDNTYQPGSVLDMPKRPPWDFNMSKEKLERREEQYFMEYLDNILEKHGGLKHGLSYVELNLETWRQLWRVIEMSDIILLITDIRHPALHFSPTLYNYITKELKKDLILVLNKIDLAPASLVVAWKKYFKDKFPDVHIICFTSFPKDKKGTEEMQDPSKVLHKKRRKGAFTAVGPKQLLKTCESIVQGHVDLSSWQRKIEEDMQMDPDKDEFDPVTDVLEEELPDTSFHNHERFRDGVLTIGCCGYPNVGKSSLINGLVGKKVVSVSKTPGHTKHFQTIFLTPTVKLCDSPGLVFPSLVPKPLQILAGIYPIAQVREPYTAVQFLAERLHLPTLLRLRHPETEGKIGAPPADSGLCWTAYDICDAWAEKRGYMTARVARADTYRAANSLLRMALEGRLCLCMRPPGFTANKEQWNSHPETEEILRQQEQHRKATQFSDDEDCELDLTETEDEETQQHNEEAEDEGSEEEEGATATRNPFALLGDD